MTPAKLINTPIKILQECHYIFEHFYPKKGPKCLIFFFPSLSYSNSFTPLVGVADRLQNPPPQSSSVAASRRPEPQRKPIVSQHWLHLSKLQFPQQGQHLIHRPRGPPHCRYLRRHRRGHRLVDSSTSRRYRWRNRRCRRCGSHQLLVLP